MYFLHGGIGEVVNTPDCGSGMQGFDPLIPPHLDYYPYFIRVFIFLGTIFYFKISSWYLIL